MDEQFVAIVMGSGSDWPVMQEAVRILQSFGIDHEVKVSSAHRTPEQTHQYVKSAEQRGAGVFIAGAGMAAHLAGTVAALTTRPVIGIPIDAGSLRGIDALLSTVQMPGGIPVATVAIGKAGARNAAYLAAQILSLSDAALAKRIAVERDSNRRKIAAQNDELQRSLTGQ